MKETDYKALVDLLSEKHPALIHVDPANAAASAEAKESEKNQSEWLIESGKKVFKRTKINIKG